ncbi:hypothetical protein N7457_001900 [Penicillium paradoxum]|uniref:uncharacterized protein n=1 Tax=Penicillium paradoxum TaxID=176176 RepID=UPI00254813E7|nr:uncharacterized protein N7457_001900 [Penicillium paradoxum]KAJ5795301.1 hypothetical protein N7457_001900 [Penicillium paradoxum]
MTGSGRWTRKPTAASSAPARGTSLYYGAPRPEINKEITDQNQQEKSITQSTGRRGEKKKSESFDNANPPAPSNPMHQNRRIPYTNAYQRISTNAETRHNAGLQYGQHKCERPVREWGVK